MVEWFSGKRAWVVEEGDDDIGDAAKKKKKAKTMPDQLVEVPDRVRHLLTECLSYNHRDRPSAKRMQERFAVLTGRSYLSLYLAFVLHNKYEQNK